jgi:tetratricopeptide (TPR) repeat protein
VIQFPAGPPAGLPQLGVESLASPRILPALADLARTPLAPADILELGKAATAALDLELLQTPAGQPAPAAGAAEYQLAIDAVKQSEHAVVLQHLEQAILIHPSYAETSRLDPAFEPVRSPVQDLVGRLSVLARMRAETSIAEASAAIESAQTTEPLPEPMPPLAPSLQSASASPVPEPSLRTTPSLPVPPAQPSPAPPNALPLPRAAVAAADLEVLRRWDDPVAREMAAMEYQLARGAVQTGDHATALEHLEQALAAQPAYAAAVAQDPAFAAIRVPVQQLVNRAITPPPLLPEVSTAGPMPDEPGDSSQAIRSGMQDVRLVALTHSLDSPDSIPQAQAYLDMARAHFELGAYAGYVVAAQAAALAQGIAGDSRVSLSLKRGAFAGSKPQGRLQPLRRAAWRTARRLWEKLPLLAILLGWFAAGVLAGLLSLPFQQGLAGMRGLLFPVWALGLVAMVLVGFVRSLRRLR